MRCDELERCLEMGMEGNLPAEAGDHLSECPRCQAVLADLKAIQAAGRQLATEETTPPERIWTSLRAELESEGLIRIPRISNVTWTERWRATLWKPATALVFATLLFGLVVLVGHFRQPPGSRPSQESEAASVVGVLQKNLTAAADRTVSAMRTRDPAIDASFRQNLRTVDELIGLCEKGVRENPHSELHREFLYGAYQQKADLLAAAVDSGHGGDE